MHSIEYDLTAEDFAAFHMLYYATAASALRTRRTFRVQMTVLSAVITGAFMYPLFGWNVWFALSGVALSALIMWLWTPGLWEKQLRQNLKKMSGGSGLGNAGTYRLVVEEGGVRETGPSAEIFVPWTGVVRITESPDYALVFFAPNQALVVPRRDDPAAVDAVVAEIRGRAGGAG